MKLPVGMGERSVLTESKAGEADREEVTLGDQKGCGVSRD